MLSIRACEIICTYVSSSKGTCCVNNSIVSSKTIYEKKGQAYYQHDHRTSTGRHHVVDNITGRHVFYGSKRCCLGTLSNSCVLWRGPGAVLSGSPSHPLLSCPPERRYDLTFTMIQSPCSSLVSWTTLAHLSGTIRLL